MSQQLDDSTRWGIYKPLMRLNQTGRRNVMVTKVMVKTVMKVCRK